jgi:hypothetical protein
VSVHRPWVTCNWFLADCGAVTVLQSSQNQQATRCFASAAVLILGGQAFVQPLRAVAMSGAQDSLTAADSQAQPLEIEIDNEAEKEFTLIRVGWGLSMILV